MAYNMKRHSSLIYGSPDRGTKLTPSRILSLHSSLRPGFFEPAVTEMLHENSVASSPSSSPGNTSLETPWSPTHKNGVPLPPGPLATWFWENPLPRQHIAHGITVLVEQYGLVVSLRRGNQVTVIIGRMDVRLCLFMLTCPPNYMTTPVHRQQPKSWRKKADRSLIAQDRSQRGEILSGGGRLLFVPAGERFRRLRRTMHTHLQPKAAATYEEIQAATAKDVIVDILNDPKRYAPMRVRGLIETRACLRYASAVILRVTYGKTSPASNDDPEVAGVHQVIKDLLFVLTPGSYLVNRIPWLKYVPGYDRQFREFRRYELELFQGQLNRVRNDMETRCAGPSSGKTLLEHVDEHRLSEDEMAYLAGSLFDAGSDTTASGIIIMIMAAACYPDAQACVQGELDEVVGQDRMLSFGDLDMLPQLQAFILEALRWRPVTPLGFAHRATKDITWKGRCIPAGATVLGCHRVISRDPESFPDPEIFNPGRWLTEDGQTSISTRTASAEVSQYPHPKVANRVCPGQHLANRSRFINLALLLWSFRILQRAEAPIDVEPAGFETVIIFHPKAFDVEFVPRMEDARLRELMARDEGGRDTSYVMRTCQRDEPVPHRVLFDLAVNLVVGDVECVVQIYT
ncbi:Cytochrome P450 [Tylopilus felleus]